MAVKPLEQEPQLAARIMIEDCMCLLLDVDDIDRLHGAYQGMRDNEGPLRQRRALLMEGFAASLHLTDSAVCSPHSAGTVWIKRSLDHSCHCELTSPANCKVLSLGLENIYCCSSLAAFSARMQLRCLPRPQLLPMRIKVAVPVWSWYV